tara:strand:+ start:7325 stop:8311 length:987 start_codon:yes stop_codon:yes gene_type:complete
MYTFQDYKKLDGDIAAVATSFWVATLMQKSHCASLYKLPVRLSHLGASILDGFNEQVSKYWYNKYHGQLLRNDIKVTAIESVLPGSSFALYHPLWFLLNIPMPANHQLLEVASNLPPKLYQRLVGEKDGELYFKELRNEIAFENTLEALTVKLLYYHLRRNYWSKREWSPSCDSNSSVETHKLFIRLFSGAYDEEYCTRLYQLVNKRFENAVATAEPFYLPNSNELISDFPLQFGKSQTVSQIKSILKAANQIINHACFKSGISNKKQKMALFNYVSWKKVGDFLKDLDTFDKTKDIKNFPYLLTYFWLVQQKKKKLTNINELDYVYR